MAQERGQRVVPHEEEKAAPQTELQRQMAIAKAARAEAAALRASAERHGLRAEALRTSGMAKLNQQHEIDQKEAAELDAREASPEYRAQREGS